MYLDYFGLKQAPFSIAPDPRYLYMSEKHREALAHLIYGVRNEGGFILVTGEVGTGKTTICRCLMEQLPEQTQVAYIFNPRQTAVELLTTICDEYGIPVVREDQTAKILVDRIFTFLLQAHAAGKNPVLIIDEAQNLAIDVLEQIRLLTNLETSRKKLLQVILIGQPELRVTLKRADLRQLAQRITARYHLAPLSSDEVSRYINHRLAVSGQPLPLFSRQVLKRVYRISQGVPRLINLICDRALLGTYAEGGDRVTLPILKRAATEVLGETADGGNGSGRLQTRLWVLLLLLILSVAFWILSGQGWLELWWGQQ
jgi:general secretion pathway protein A